MFVWMHGCQQKVRSGFDSKEGMSTLTAQLHSLSSGQGEVPYRRYSPRAERHDSVKLRSRQLQSG